MTTSTLQRFASELVACHGGVAEAAPDRPDALDLLLPGDLAGRLRLEEEARIVEGPAEEGAVRLAYGSELLERMVQVATAEQPVAVATLPEALPHSSNIAEAALHHFTGLNCVLRPSATEPFEQWGGYLIVDWRFSADADERREGLVRVAVSEQDGAEVTLVDRLDSHPLLEPGLPGELGLQIPADKLWRRVERLVRRHTRRTLGPVMQAVRRRHLRDRQRLRGYFDGLRIEMEQRLRRSRQRHGSGSDETAARQDKLQALGPELERKLADLTARYRLRVELAPVAALRVAVRVRCVELTVRRRSTEGSVLVRQSAATRTFDPLCCEACGAAMRAFALCDERLHRLCAACHEARPSARSCPACRK